MTYAASHETQQILHRSVRLRMGLSQASPPCFEEARGQGRPRIHSLRDILDAIFFYVLKSGCPWRLLPRCFPPWKSVYHWFRK